MEMQVEKEHLFNRDGAHVPCDRGISLTYGSNGGKGVTEWADWRD